MSDYADAGSFKLSTPPGEEAWHHMVVVNEASRPGGVARACVPDWLQLDQYEADWIWHCLGGADRKPRHFDPERTITPYEFMRLRDMTYEERQAFFALPRPA